MEDFSFKRDIKRINWKDTLQINLIRSIFAGMVWFFIRLFVETPSGETFVMLLFPLAYLVILLPIGLFANVLSSMGIPFIGIITVIISILIVVGDPLTYFLHKTKPELIPIEHYGFFNFRIIIFVLS